MYSSPQMAAHAVMGGVKVMMKITEGYDICLHIKLSKHA